MDNYVLVILTDTQFKDVLLIKKQRPKWQKNSLNGLGGKLYYGEAPLTGALREVYEESGIELEEEELIPIGYTTENSKWFVNIFAGATDKIYDVENQTDEELIYVDTHTISMHKYKMITDLPWIIELCLFRLKEKFDVKMSMVYK